MKVQVLGSIEADNGAPIALGGPTQRRILAILAMQAGEVVSLDRLVDATWADDDIPAQADRNVRTYIHRLRIAVGETHAERIETAPPGYRFHLDDTELDLTRFDALAATASRLADTGDTVGALDRIDEAEQLWQGRPFGEFADEPWARAEVERLTEVHITLLEQRSELLLEAGHSAAAVAASESLTKGFPLRERPRALLMQALYQAGRQPEALRAFQDYRRIVLDDIGVTPSDELVALDRAIAAGDAGVRRKGTAPRQIGAFELHERIGEGAFAVVHRATQPSLGRDVAMKLVRAELANRPEFIRRFEAEAQMVACIEHPNVVPLYDYWREPDRACLVMRWMTGGSLETRLDKGPLPLENVVSLVDEISGALDAAHAAGVVHRDVKPANILFDDDGRAYLGDFGIALAASELATPEAALSEGSPIFASPEQLRKEVVGPPADVHALGIVAYTALTGATPFAHTLDPVEQLRRQLEEEIPSTGSPFGEVLSTATSKDPRDRYPTAGGFAAALRAAAAGEHRRPARPQTAVGNPYKGLRPFDETDADDFYGRERLVQELTAQLTIPDATLLSVVGPSGSGKSSVVRAGLVPALRAGRVAGSAQWFASSLTPGAHPYEALETALLRVAINPPGSLLEQLREHPRGILRAVQRILPTDETALLLVIDQFEELFTAASDGERDAFLDSLTVALTEPGTPLRVVLTLRADFYDRPLRHSRFAPLLKRSTVAVIPPAPDELERAIVGPAESVGVEFEPGLVAQVVAEVAAQPGALPLMQYALTELFEECDDALLTLDGYRALGGLTGALARRADDLYAASDRDERTATRATFGRLITLGEGSEDTRRRVRLSELAVDSAAGCVVERFGAARLLTFDRDAATREPTVEVAHEALIREWPRLRTWLDEDRDSLRVHRHITAAAAGWIESDRADGELYRGIRLHAAETWTQTTTPQLNDLETEFLSASGQRRDVEEASERNRVRRLRGLLAATAVVAVLAVIASAVAFRQQQRADDQAALAEANEIEAVANANEAASNAALANSRTAEAEAATKAADAERLGAVSGSISTESPRLATLLAIERFRADPSVESLTSIHQALAAVPGYHGTMGATPYLEIETFGTEGLVAAVGFDAIDIWDLDDRTLKLSIEHPNPAQTAVLASTPDGRIAAARSSLEETRLYDLTDGSPLGTIEHDGPVNDLTISPDGSRLAAALGGGGVEVWDLRTRERTTSIRSGTDDVLMARWDPSGESIATVSLLSEVVHWDLATGEVLWRNAPPAGNIVNENTPFGALFTPSGDRFVLHSGSLGAEIRVLDSVDGTLVSTLRPPTGAGFRLDAFYWDVDTPGRLVLPSGGNVTAIDISSGTQAEVLERFIGRGDDVAYDRLRDRFVIATSAGLEVWAAAPTTPLSRQAPLTPGQIATLASEGGPVLHSLSADGAQLLVSVFSLALPPATTRFDLTADDLVPAAFGEDPTIVIGFGEVTLAALADFGGVQLLAPDNQPLGNAVPFPFDFTELAASENGSHFAFGRLGGHADLYTGSGEFIGTVSIGEGDQYEGAQAAPTFTADGAYMSVLTTRGGFGLWRTDPLERIEIPFAESWSSGLVAGSWLFMISEDGTIQRFDPDTLESVGVPLVDAGGLGYGKVDGTNLRLAVGGGAANAVRVLDLETGIQIAADLPYSGGSTRYEFSADGSTLAIGSGLGITLWNFDTKTWADIACETAGRNLTRDEWDQLGPRTIDRRATCPQFPLS